MSETINLRDAHQTVSVNSIVVGNTLVINGVRYIVGEDMIARRDHRNRHQRRKDEAERRKKP